MEGNPIRQLRELPGKAQKLGRDDFELSNGVAGEESVVATYEAEVPLEVREGARARIQFVTAEEFTTDGSAGDAETFDLAHNLVETNNATNLVLYESGNRVQPDSVDYAADSFDYTDDGTDNTLHAFYVARDPGRVRIEKVAPKTSAQVSEDLENETTSGLADRDQNKEPVTFDYGKPGEGVVPTDWTLRVVVDAPFAVAFNDDDLATTTEDTASNALLELPIYQYEGKVAGLGQAIKAEAIGLGR
jgi:hypothetical protein